ncbi:MAG TPA: hypothetical protein VNW97_09740 [Candidatus Saccharimonadales bacterium]|jgi:hypothetical protein|nr:hypothetical protein [Candidatus Saccharimonadales bacterium]
MLDKKKGDEENDRNIRDIPEELFVAQPAKQVVESEVEYVAKRIAKDQGVRERLKRSLDDSRSGRVVASAEAMKRLKRLKKSAS